MLCPAVSDPFYGRGYRLFAFVHQALLIPIIGKFIVWTSLKFKLAKPNDVLEIKVFVSDSEEHFSDCDRKNVSGQGISSATSRKQDNGLHANSVMSGNSMNSNGSSHFNCGDAPLVLQGNGHAKQL